MTVLLRAIVTASDLHAARDLELRSVSGATLAALVGPWDRARTASEADLLEHHRIVQAIFERVPCLPARFGSVFADDAAVRDGLARRESELAAQLALLGHRCELAITCAWRDKGATPAVAAPQASSGRAYLERGLERTRSDRARQQRAEDIAARLLSELEVEQAFIRHRTCPRPAVAVSMSALVTRDEIETICSRLERLGAQLPDVTVVVQGPWAPYTFAVSE